LDGGEAVPNNKSTTSAPVHSTRVPIKKGKCQKESRGVFVKVKRY